MFYDSVSMVVVNNLVYGRIPFLTGCVLSMRVRVLCVMRPIVETLVVSSCVCVLFVLCSQCTCVVLFVSAVLVLNAVCSTCTCVSLLF